MSYESDPAGLGVGKTFGPRGLGDVNGVVKTEGQFVEVVFEVTKDTAGADYTYQLYPFYLIEDLTLEVEEAFDALTTANLSIDGGAGLTTPLDLATKAISKPALTGLANAAGDDSKTSFPLVMTLSDTDQGSGKARIVVRYRKV